MRIGPNRRTPVELKDQLLQASRAYKEGKQALIEQSVTSLEAKTKPLLVGLFLALAIASWLIAIFAPGGFAKLYDAYRAYPVIAFFAFSYFAFFLGSKIIFKPSEEELADDSSPFALFSACERREKRSLISVGLGLLHTVVFVLYLILKDAK